MLHSGSMAHIKDIPADLLEQYKARTITSAKLASLTGFHAVSLRRALKRDPLIPAPRNKTKLLALRQLYRQSISHLPPSEISKLAHVSLSTANRIRKKYAK